MSSDKQITSLCIRPPRPTQHPTLGGKGNKYWPKCSDALQMVSKSRHG